MTIYRIFYQKIFSQCKVRYLSSNFYAQAQLGCQMVKNEQLEDAKMAEDKRRNKPCMYHL